MTALVVLTSGGLNGGVFNAKTGEIAAGFTDATLIGVLFMIPLVVKITKNYVDRKVKKKDVAPILSYDPEIEAEAVKTLDQD